MAKIKVTLNLKGINEVMTSPGVEAKLAEIGDKIASSANAQLGSGADGSTFESHVASKRHPWVARVYVTPQGMRARYHNLKHNTLLKALDAGGG